LLPDVQDNAWFFDTELLMLAQRRRLRIWDIPITWVEDPDSTVDIVRTALADLRGIARLRFRASSRPRSSPAGHGCETDLRRHRADTELISPEQHR
jgi:hypothetical protein